MGCYKLLNCRFRTYQTLIGAKKRYDPQIIDEKEKKEKPYTSRLLIICLDWLINDFDFSQIFTRVWATLHVLEF